MKKDEEIQQKALVEWLRIIDKQHDLLWWHTPNGGARNVIVGAILKAMGVRRGVSDLFFANPTAEYNCLAIEMKASAKDYPSKEQREFLAHIKRIGGRAEIIWDWVKAKELIVDHYKL